MAASSPDQQSGEPTSPVQLHARKRRVWLYLLLNIILFILGVAAILGVFAYFKVLPPQWYGPLFGVLSPVLGGVGGFVRTTLADRDFQEALRKRLTRWVADDGGEKGDESEKAKGSSASVLPNVTINVAPVITNTNTASTAMTPAAPAPATHPVASPAEEQPQQSAAIKATASVPGEIVFLIGASLPDAGEFYGRLAERMTLFGRTRKAYSTSIVGPRRIGKTWLMSFLQYALVEEFGAQFRVGYIDATRPSCATPAGFTACTLEALGMAVPAAMHAQLDLSALEEAMKHLRQSKLTPVLCIDEFESFADHGVFDLHFFAGLRSLAGPGLGLCMVIASKAPLIDIVGEIGKTSGFFNIFEQLTLKPFDSEEADAFIAGKGAQAGFDEQERDYVRTYGRVYGPQGPQWPPLRLQIVGALLQGDKQLAAVGHHKRYRPDEVSYWKAFEERLEERYRGMVNV